MNTNIKITKDNKVIYTTNPSPKVLKFTYNNLDIETEYHDKLIQAYFTKKLLDCDILPIQYNQTMMPLTDPPKLYKLNEVQITIEEELFVVLQSNKLVQCHAIGRVIFKRISKNLKFDILHNYQSLPNKTCTATVNTCYTYRRKEHLPVKVIFCQNKIVIENSEPKVRNFVLQMPVRNNVYHVNFKLKHGNASFDLKNERVTWSISTLSKKKVVLEYEICVTNSVELVKKQLTANVYFEIDPVENTGIDIVKVYDDDGVKDGYVHKIVKVRSYEIRL